MTRKGTWRRDSGRVAKEYAGLASELPLASLSPEIKWKRLCLTICGRLSEGKKKKNTDLGTLPSQVIKYWLRWFDKLVVDNNARVKVYNTDSCQIFAIFCETLLS